MNSPNIYQIYYNESTKNSLDPGFIPLDNSENSRPDWYEFHVIRSFLNKTKLNDNEWYGFLSPNFRGKTRLTSKAINNFLDFSEGKAEVALIPAGWDQIAYFQNPFEQGEIWHPGITELSQSVLNFMDFDVNLIDTVYHSGNFAFSNYIIAKPNYWYKWLSFANTFFELVENNSTNLPTYLQKHTTYGSSADQAPIKTFIQERMPFLIILKNLYRTSTFDLSSSIPVFNRIFYENTETRKLLKSCDLLKRKFTESNNHDYLIQYKNTRKLINTKL